MGCSASSSAAVHHGDLASSKLGPMTNQSSITTLSHSNLDKNKSMPRDKSSSTDKKERQSLGENSTTYIKISTKTPKEQVPPEKKDLTLQTKAVTSQHSKNIQHEDCSIKEAAALRPKKNSAIARKLERDRIEEEGSTDIPYSTKTPREIEPQRSRQDIEQMQATTDQAVTDATNGKDGHSSDKAVSDNIILKKDSTRDRPKEDPGPQGVSLTMSPKKSASSEFRRKKETEVTHDNDAKEKARASSRQSGPKISSKKSSAVAKHRSSRASSAGSEEKHRLTSPSERMVKITSKDEKTQYVVKAVKSKKDSDEGEGERKDILIQTDVISVNENNEKTKRKLLIKMRKLGSKTGPPYNRSLSSRHPNSIKRKENEPKKKISNNTKGKLQTETVEKMDKDKDGEKAIPGNDVEMDNEMEEKDSDGEYYNYVLYLVLGCFQGI